MNRTTFFSKIRASLFSGALTGPQVSGIEAILAEADRRNEPLNNVAYALATAQWETANTMQPIREYGKGKGRKYGVPAGPYRHVYYGRGLVQLTWLFNYEKASKKLGFDFVKYPDAVMDPKWAVRILFEGMAGGWFTGKSFKSYIDNIDESDAEDGREYEGARRIINGTDKAKQIAGYALKYEAALRAAGYGLVAQPRPVIPPDTSTPVVYQKQPEVILNSDGVSHTVDKPVAPTVRKSLIAEIIALIVALFKRK